jgi:hypothetical protein
LGLLAQISSGSFGIGWQRILAELDGLPPLGGPTSPAGGFRGLPGGDVATDPAKGGSGPNAGLSAGASERSSVERRSGQAGRAGLGGDLNGNGAGYFPVSALLRAPLDGLVGLGQRDWNAF